MAGKTWNSSYVMHLLSEERMATYVTAADGDFDNAFELYAWNIQLATALQGATAMVEVVVRNAIDHALTSWHHVIRPGGDWFNLPVFNEPTRNDIAVARARCAAAAREEHTQQSIG